MKKTTAMITAALISASVVTLPVTAQAKALNGEQINSLIKGKNVALKTKFGTFPLRYRADGVVVGDGSKLGLAKFFAPKESGKWWVRGTQLCQQWPTWYKGKTLCFKIEKLGPSKIKWIRNDGATGTATIRG